MSTSERYPNDFEFWIADEFTAGGDFTALIVLADITDVKITPLCSTYLNVIGDDVAWADMTVLFAGAGQDWHGAAFFPVRATQGGPLDNPRARLRLQDLESRINENRLVLNEGHFFDRWGRRLKVEEVELQ